MKTELKFLGMSKKQFAADIGYNYQVVVGWGEKPPVVVDKYVKLLVRRKLDRERMVCGFSELIRRVYGVSGEGHTRGREAVGQESEAEGGEEDAGDG